MVIQITGGEGCQGLTVQAVWRGSAGFDDVTFVEFEFYFTGHVFLCGLYECLDSLAQRCEPLPSYTT